MVHIMLLLLAIFDLLLVPIAISTNLYLIHYIWRKWKEQAASISREEINYQNVLPLSMV